MKIDQDKFEFDISHMLDRVSSKPENKAAIYARKSILNENNSIESQISLAREKLFEHNLLLHDIYTDEISATRYHFKERPGFSRLLKDACEGLFKTVIVFRRDRLARNVDDFKDIQFRFKQNNIKVIYSNDGEYQESTHPSGDFIENIIVAMDELEAHLINQRTKAGIAKKRERGEYSSGGRVPFGYNRPSTDESLKSSNDSIRSYSEYIPQEPQCSYIRKLFQKYPLLGSNIDGKTYTKKDLINDLGSFINEKAKVFTSNPSSSKKYKAKADIEYLSGANINKIIQNPIYAGYIFRSSETKITDIFKKNDQAEEFSVDYDKLILCSNVSPVLETRLLWENAIIKWRSSYKQHVISDEPYLFRGLLKCSSCSKHITLSRTENNAYYKCQKGCSNIPANELTALLINQILDDLYINDSIQEYIDGKVKSFSKKIDTAKNDLIKNKQFQENLLLNIAELTSHSERIDPQEYELELKTLASLSEKEDRNMRNIAKLQNTILSLKRSKKEANETKEHFIREELKVQFESDIKKAQTLLTNMIEEVTINAGESNEGEPEDSAIDYGRES